MQKIKTIVLKEWAEVFRNQLVLFTVIFMPLMFAAIPIGILYTTRGATASELMAQVPKGVSELCPPGLSVPECFQVYMLSQFMLLFMLTPLMVPVNIAAYSVVGEKTSRSLEPLLATPITTYELLIGKNLAAVIPAVLATWLSFGIYAIGAKLMVANPRVVAALFAPVWLLAVLLVGPLLAILSVNFSLMVSSRVNDARVAEQLSAVVILPLLVLFFGQLAGIVLVNRQMMLLLSLALAALDVVMLWIVARLFQRESILVRWR